MGWDPAPALVGTPAALGLTSGEIGESQGGASIPCRDSRALESMFAGEEVKFRGGTTQRDLGLRVPPPPASGGGAERPTDSTGPTSSTYRRQRPTRTCPSAGFQPPTLPLRSLQPLRTTDTGSHRAGSGRRALLLHLQAQNLSWPQGGAACNLAN